MLYSFTIDGESMITRVDAYYEGADVQTFVERGRARLGEPEITVVAGVRVFSWRSGGLLRSVAVMDRGVRASTVQLPQGP